MYTCLNALPNDEILDQSKLNPFAGNEINILHNNDFVLERIKNIVEKEENAGDQKLFSKSLWLRVAKSRDCMVKG